MRGIRLTAFAGATLVLLSVGVTLADPGEELAACRVPGQATIRPDRWVKIAPPKFDAGEGPSQITSVSPLPYQPNGLLVSNGTVVKLSVDAGCTWGTVYTPNAVNEPIPGYTPDVVTQVVAATDSVAWVTTYDDVDSMPHPNVYWGQQVGVDGTTPTWTQIDVGLPAYGKPVSLVAGRSSVAGDAYLLADELPNPQSGSLATSRHLYGTYSPNNTATEAANVNYAWREITPPTGFGHIDGVTYQTSDTIWIWSGRSYAWTSDAGSTDSSGQSNPTWHTGTAAAPIVTVDVNALGEVSVVERTGSTGTINVFDQRNRLVLASRIPIAPTLFAHGDGSGVYVASGPQGTWGLDHRLVKWVDITPRNGPAFSSLTMTHGTSVEIVLAQTSSALWRWDTYYGETFIKPPPPPPTVCCVKIPTSNVTRPTLCVAASCTNVPTTAVQKVVTVAPGKVANVPVRFLNPPDATPLDVFYIVDTTESMSPAIEGLKKAVVAISKNLRSTLGTSVCFGVGDVKDWDPQAGAFRSPYVFKTWLPVSPCDNTPGLAHVVAATKNLSQFGGYDIPEAQTVALTQAVTGAGQVYVPEAAGNQAGFRHKAFKVIVLITDSNSHEGNGYPTIQQTIQTLNSADVKIVSIAINGDSSGDVNAANAMMDELARGTNSLAPPSGVDCNGDGGGQPGDLGPGQPLVCNERVTNSVTTGPIVNLGPAIIALLLGVKDPGTMDTQIADPQGALQGPIKGSTSAVLDMKYETGLQFTMPVGCGLNQVGKNLPISVMPYVRSLPTHLQGQVIVQCRAPAPPKILFAAPLAPEVFFVPHAPKPPVAVAPPNVPGQPVTNINMNTGFAQEEQQQPQLAMATQDNAEEQQEEPDEVLAMSARRTSTDRSEIEFVLAAAALLSAAAGCQMQLRRRSAHAVQRAR